MFQSVGVFAPGLLRDDELPQALKTWSGDDTFLRAYGAAFAPNPHVAHEYELAHNLNQALFIETIFPYCVGRLDAAQ
jgi:hypothetical protein